MRVAWSWRVAVGMERSWTEVPWCFTRCVCVSVSMSVCVCAFVGEKKERGEVDSMFFNEDWVNVWCSNKETVYRKRS